MSLALLAAALPVFLGVVEQVDQKPVVHPAFYYTGGTWHALPADRDPGVAFPDRVKWTIAFNGTSRGHFDAMGRRELLPNPPEPDSFHYWNPTKYRPMVVVSQPNVADPDHWKPATAPAELEARLIPLFRKEVAGAPSHCEGDSVRYADQAIRVRKSYMSASGVRLVQLALDDKPIRRCDGPRDEAYDSRWFYVNGGESRFVGQSLELIDAGDYDRDGHSEVIFHKSGYNLDGYVLLYGGLSKQVQFSWSYH